MKAKESANSAIRIISGQISGTPDAIFTVGVGRAAECPTIAKAWPDATWCGCEPHPEHYTDNENFPGVIYPVAVTGEDGEAQFYLKKNHSHGSSVFTRYVHCDKEITVPTRTLDTIYKEEGPFGTAVLLWLDCEGSELAVLSKCDAFLRSVRWINVEMVVEPTRDGWPSHIAVDDRLRELGFVRVQIHSHNVGHGMYDAIYTRPEFVNWTEVLCPCSHTREVTVQ